MLEMTKGSYAPLSDELSEQYEKSENLMLANVDASKIEDVIAHFVCMQESLIFFFLELPAEKTEEKKLRSSDSDPMHTNVYFIDGLDVKQALYLFSEYSDLLINDGISTFGFGNHDGTAEIRRGKYNAVTLWSTELEKYEGFFEEHDIPKVEKCVTACDTFSDNAPGMAFRITVDGLTVYDLPEKLKDRGIYFFGQREEEWP